MNREQIIEFLESEIERLKEKAKESIENDSSYKYYLSKLEYVKYIYKRVHEEQTDYDIEDEEE